MSVALRLSAYHIKLLDSLVIARADRANNYDDFARHLWWLALVIAHELVHILRLHVRKALASSATYQQVHYLLLGTVMIPYKTPPRILGTDGALSKDGEAGWDWDKALLGGLVRAGWVNDDAYRQQQPASTPAHIGEDVDRVAAVLGVRPDVSPSSDEVADVAQERFVRNIKQRLLTLSIVLSTTSSLRSRESCTSSTTTGCGPRSTVSRVRRSDSDVSSRS